MLRDGLKGTFRAHPYTLDGVGTLAQWLKLLAWKVGDRGFEPRPCIQVSKKQNVSSLLTAPCSQIQYCGELRRLRRTRPQTARVRISNTVSGGQCHLIHLAILKRFSRPSLV